jgi:hypothetical protein
MIAAADLKIVKYAYLRLEYFRERPAEEVSAKLINEFHRAPGKLSG